MQICHQHESRSFWQEHQQQSACWPVGQKCGVTANLLQQVCAWLPDLFNLAVFSSHFCLRDWCGSEQRKPNYPSSPQAGPRTSWCTRVLGEVKERFHHSGMCVSRGQCNQPGFFHHKYEENRDTALFDVKAVCGYVMDRWPYLLLLQKRRQCNSPPEWVSQESAYFLVAGGSDVAPGQRQHVHVVFPASVWKPGRLLTLLLCLWKQSSPLWTVLGSHTTSKRGDVVGKALRNGCKGEGVCGSATKFLCNLVQVISHICASISSLWCKNSSTSSHPCNVLNQKIFQGKTACSQVNIQGLASQGTFSPTCFLVLCLGFVMTVMWGKLLHLCVTCICVKPQNVISFPEVCPVIRQMKCPSPLVITH